VRPTQIHRVRGHSFLPGLLPSTPQVVDCGANHGEFASALVHQYGARVTSVEPNPELIGDVERSGASGVRAAAIAEQADSVWLAVEANDEASTIVGTRDPDVGNAVRVDALSLSALLEEIDLDRVDLLKLDIEGAEIAALEGLRPSRLATIDQVTVEFHDSQGWTPPSEIRRVCRSLGGNGFLPVRMSVRHWGDVLFVRRARLRPFEQLRLRWFARPLEFARRARDRRGLEA
jgi:FkbM family methyltransferase